MNARAGQVYCAGKGINHFKQKGCILRPTDRSERIRLSPLFSCIIDFPCGIKGKKRYAHLDQKLYFFFELALILHCSVELLYSLLYLLCWKMPSQL